jgi:hypothetical protein
MRNWKIGILALGLAVSIGFLVSGCTTTSSGGNDPAPPPPGLTTPEVGSGGSASLSASNGTVTFVFLDDDQNPIVSTNYLNINNIRIDIWSTTTATWTATATQLTAPQTGTAAPIDFGLCLDRSGSMYWDPTDMPSLEAAAKTFVNNMQTGDVGCVVNFDDTNVVDQPMTSVATLLVNAIENPSLWNGGTKLFDAIVTTVGTVAAGTNTRKAVIAMTDGDSSAGVGEAAAIAAANAAGIPLYMVGLGNYTESQLRSLADATGGFTYLTPTAAELVDLYNKISTALSSAWSLTFSSSVTFTTSTVYYVKITITYSDGTTASAVFVVTAS